jgi:acyl-CoA synthetase (AMP-forming)/AMP-acid ligase II
MLVHGYGMTETNAVHTAIAGEDYVDHPDSVGWVVPVCEVKIVDPETKKELPTGEVGLIFMRGQNVMTHYVDDPEATAKAFDKDGWLDSGDVGCLDEDELLYIRDRSKDMIIRGGENIASLEVENALYLDARIAEAAAVPVPCPLMGERVGAMVSMAPGATATPESVMSEVFPRLRHAARPVIVLVHPEPLRESRLKYRSVADISAQCQRQDHQDRRQADRRRAVEEGAAPRKALVVINSRSQAVYHAYVVSLLDHTKLSVSFVLAPLSGLWDACYNKLGLPRLRPATRWSLIT